MDNRFLAGNERRSNEQEHEGKSSALAAPQQSARLNVGEEDADVAVGVLRGLGVVPVAAPHPCPQQGEEDQAGGAHDTGRRVREAVG